MGKFTNGTNFIEEIKFHNKLRSKIIFFTVFLLWIIGYAVIMKVENTFGDALAYFLLGFFFALITLASALLVPAHRENSLRFFKFGMIGYSLYTIMFELVYLATMQGASNMQVTLKNFCLYGRIMIPIGLIIWQGKEIFLFFKGKRTKNQEIENIKEHGNDGF
jgi:hypothetical protein